MATHTWTSAMAHSSDATFQAWATDLYQGIEAVGLTHVPQTGELALPVVAARPAVGVAAGFRMYRFDDPLQASAPIFIKIIVGTSASAVTRPMIQIGAGSAVDGSGGLVANGSDRVPIDFASTGAITLNAGNKVSYACLIDGCFSLLYKAGAMTRGAAAAFKISRTCNTDGSYNGVGYTFYRGNDTGAGKNAASMSTVRLQSPLATTSSNAACTFALAPGTLGASGGYAGEIEAYLCFYNDPLTRPDVSMCAVYDAEFPLGTVFTATLVGSTPVSYMSWAGECGYNSADGAGKIVSAAMRWE